MDMSDEYLFGSSLLVAPVMSMGQRSRSVYLPAGASWYDLWTGTLHPGGGNVDIPTPLDKMPLFVKAGAILPWGPAVQFAGEKKWDDLELRIYAGANGQFTLYEDEGEGYDYEKGAFSEIGFHWDDATRILSISDRNGSFPGMLANRRFRIVLADIHKGIGDLLTGKADKVISYKGKAISIKM